MTEGTLSIVTAWSYGLTAAVCFALATRIVIGWQRGARANLLLTAVLTTAIWASLCAILTSTDSVALEVAATTTDLLRYAAWYAFIANLLSVARNREGQVIASAPISPLVLGAVTAALLATLTLSLSPQAAVRLGLDPQRAEFGLRIGLAVLGLALAEQLYRSAQPNGRWAIKPLCIALAGIFGFELFIYSDALMFAGIDRDIWAARGVANALVLPFIAVSTARNAGWQIDLHLSRKAMLQSTALLVSGVFLVAVGAAGYFVRYWGGAWGRALQIELLFAAALLVVLIASSGRFRSRLKVFVSKHFFSYRYDYREEWLRFTEVLSSETSTQGLQERIIMALANLVESPGGMLWFRVNDVTYQPQARWNLPALAAPEPVDGNFAAFMLRTGWLVNVREYATAPERYSGLTLPAWLAAMPDAWVVIPLISGQELLGFVVLASPRANVELDWEVRDLLKTASRQAASYLGQVRATEALLESRKFEAFNRMSAFVVHDLKNLVAQLSLMLRNAERHRDNPEFQRDMLSTVQHVVERMNGLMLQLRTSATPVESPRQVDLGAIIERVCAAKSAHAGQIGIELTSGVAAIGHEERLEHVIGHLVQNALDATAARGQVRVRLQRGDGTAIVEVVDTGVGMTAEFVRQHLFKPFETTKPTGMGIGVYESSQYVSGLGGRIVYDSSPDAGTRVRIELPQRDASASARAPSLREAV